MRLMIVDDHLGVRQLIRQFVATAHDTVCECASGDEAIRVAPSFKPDAVTMDVRMPGSCGLTATRAIRAALPDTRIIIVTSHDQPDLSQAAAEAGAAGFVLKDNLSHLRAMVRVTAPVSEPPVARTHTSAAGAMRALLVLMVDTSADDCELITSRLAAAGYTLIVERVQTGEDFQHALDRGRWDLVLTEYKLPTFTGASVIQAVRGRELPPPVVCITRNFQPEHANEVLRAGAHACIDKNALGALGEIVRQALASATEGSSRQ